MYVVSSIAMRERTLVCMAMHQVARSKLTCKHCLSYKYISKALSEQYIRPISIFAFQCVPGPKDAPPFLRENIQRIWRAHFWPNGNRLE